jgi:hypothetical protein
MPPNTHNIDNRRQITIETQADVNNIVDVIQATIKSAITAINIPVIQLKKRLISNDKKIKF